MYCPNCGSKITSYVKICKACGFEFDSGILKQMEEEFPYFSTLDDAELVAKAKSGDQEAITELYNRNYTSVLYTVRSVIKDEDTAMDLLQDTFIKAFRKLDTLGDPARFSAWIIRIAENTALDWVRKKKPTLFSDMSYEGEDPGDSFENQIEDDYRFDMPEEVIDLQETQRLLGEILDGIPEDQRIVIGLYYYDEWSVKDIAMNIGISESAVKSRLAYGRKKVKSQVEELRRQGTPLYGLIAVPFLLFLYNNLDAKAGEIMPDRAVLSSITDAVGSVGAATSSSTGSGVSAAASGTEKAVSVSDETIAHGTTAASKAAAGTGTAVTGTTAGGIGVKTAAIIAAVTVGAGGVGYVLTHNQADETQEEITEEIVIEETAEEVVEEIFEEDIEEEEQERESELITFDTSGQIEETVLYNANNVVITAEKLVYSEDSVDLIFRVENNTGGYISILNASGGNGVIFTSKIGGNLFYPESLASGEDGEGLPTGTSEIALSYDMKQLIYSGLSCIPSIETTLNLYYAESYVDGYPASHTTLIDENSIEVNLSTALANGYNTDENLFLTNTLSDAWQEAFGYTVLVSETENVSEYCSSAAVIEEEDGSLILLAEFTEVVYNDWFWGMYYSFFINEAECNDAESFWINQYRWAGSSDGSRFVYMTGISAEDREVLGLDDIYSVSLIYDNGWEDPVEILSLYAD